MKRAFHARRLILAALFVGSAFPALQAQEASLPSLFSSTRMSSLGGYHAALGDDFSSIFSNPAAFAYARPEFSVAELSAVVSGPVFATINAMGSGGGLPALTAIFSQPVHAAFDLGGPLSLGYVGKGLGIGLFNRSFIGIDAPDLSNLRAYASEDILLAAGYGFSLSLGGTATLDFGFMVKGFVRGSYQIQDSLIGLFTLLSSADPMAALMGEPFDLTMGVGADLGLSLSFGEEFRFAVTALDAYTPAFISRYATLSDFLAGGAPTPVDGLVAPRLNAGILWAPALGELDQYFTSFKLLVDYNDILSLFELLPRNAFLNLSLGLELTLLDIISLRAGLNEGYLAAGVGIDLSFFTLNIAMFGRELGREPGQVPLFNLAIGLEFRY